MKHQHNVGVSVLLCLKLFHVKHFCSLYERKHVSLQTMLNNQIQIEIASVLDFRGTSMCEFCAHRSALLTIRTCLKARSRCRSTSQL
ncbi:hypothetical protein A3I45_00055 [Candidatus Uhrbacteria bacterium RIFCSPLOWO2_02_FULL_53_10]|uniref:Uncharacterized protein n=1 Tax=Candidatus Uhrbacteria bacterium RIFCSPLOWO2_02_FULL_53_10 TaxID=1802411 RepID=A0A1F7VIM3_9BACT|nr:MAG: hypothetical protein A3I45_00055 [Candidatus Uhrbacteria bacterium RIFCSPLOWO2_02_FULL_53_10]